MPEEYHELSQSRYAVLWQIQIWYFPNTNNRRYCCVTLLLSNNVLFWTLHLYFVNTRQPTKYQFCKRNKNVAPFNIWQMFWEVGHPIYLGYYCRWSYHFTYHERTL